MHQILYFSLIIVTYPLLFFSLRIVCVYVLHGCSFLVIYVGDFSYRYRPVYICRIEVNLFVKIRTPIKSLTEVPFKLKLDRYRFILKLFIARCC